MKLRHLLIITLLTFSSYLANAQFITNFNIGTPAGSIRDSRTNVKYLAYGPDITIVHHANIQGDDKHKQTYFDNFWLSGGAVMIKDGQVAKIYGEFGYWLLFNVGFGYTYNNLFESKRNNYHMFIGLPIPISNPGKKLIAYIEPYTRFKIAGDPGSLNDYGAMIKLSWHFVKIE